VSILYNEPSLPSDHPDYAQEAGVIEAVDAVEGALAEAGHLAQRSPVGGQPLDIADALRQNRADVIVNLCEWLGGVGGGESQVTGLLEMTGIPFTGSGSECLSLVLHKARTKWLLRGAGLPTAGFQYLPAVRPVAEDEVVSLLDSGPVIVKPAHEDASLGIGPESVVRDAHALAAQIDRVRRRYGDVMVEQFLPGREFNAGILALPESTLLPLAEIEYQPGASGLVSYDAKWTPGTADYGGTPVRCPAQVSEDLAAEINRVSLAAFHLTGARDYARVDLRLDTEDRVCILEVNANPDISPSAGLARAILASGMPYREFVRRLVETAARRSGHFTLSGPGLGKRAISRALDQGRNCSAPPPPGLPRWSAD
ncbi:MAG: D-alanine--D-alanine ligase family protein, partial [Candidatus Saccharimonadales bacterium]